MSDNDKPTGMSLQEWRAYRAKTISRTLPSGLAVKLRKVALLDLVAEGQIPETLDALVHKATSQGFGISDTKQFMPLVNLVTRLCVVEPAIAPDGEEAGDDRLALSEIPVEDRLEIFNWACGAANALRPFPEESASGLEPGPARAEIRAAAE